MNPFNISVMYLELRIFQFVQNMLSSEWDWSTKKWISNDDAVTEAIPEDLKSISKTRQVEVEPNREGSSVPGLQWTVTDDSLQAGGGTNKEIEAPKAQKEDSFTGIFSIRPDRIVRSVQCLHETTSEMYLD